MPNLGKLVRRHLGDLDAEVLVRSAQRYVRPGAVLRVVSQDWAVVSISSIPPGFVSPEAAPVSVGSSGPLSCR